MATMGRDGLGAKLERRRRRMERRVPKKATSQASGREGSWRPDHASDPRITIAPAIETKTFSLRRRTGSPPGCGAIRLNRWCGHIGFILGPTFSSESSKVILAVEESQQL